MSLKDNVEKIKADIRGAILLAVSKAKPAEMIQEAYEAGARHFGENYLQEAEAKIKELSFLDITWHFIGNLQTNKIKKIVPLFDVIQSVTSEKHIEEINKRAEESGKTQKIMIEIYLGDEDSKVGVTLEKAEGLAKLASERKNIELIGIMMMTPFTMDIEERRPYFSEAKMFFDAMKERHPSIRYLSMGMSSDYMIAIEEGSNMVRIGTALFGERAIVKP